MDRFKKMNLILDACLTTELINQVYPPQAFHKDKDLALPEKRDRHRLAQIKVMEKAGAVVQKELGKILQGEELAEFCRRVDGFLLANGFEIKQVL